MVINHLQVLGWSSKCSDGYSHHTVLDLSPGSSPLRRFGWGGYVTTKSLRLYQRCIYHGIANTYIHSLYAHIHEYRIKSQLFQKLYKLGNPNDPCFWLEFGALFWCLFRGFHFELQKKYTYIKNRVGKTFTEDLHSLPQPLADIQRLQLDAEALHASDHALMFNGGLNMMVTALEIKHVSQGDM